MISQTVKICLVFLQKFQKYVIYRKNLGLWFFTNHKMIYINLEITEKLAYNIYEFIERRKKIEKLLRFKK